MRHASGIPPPLQPEDLRFAVELWSDDDQNIDEVLAPSSKIVIARAALDAAINEFPGRIITLCQGGRLIDRTAKRRREAERLTRLRTSAYPSCVGDSRKISDRMDIKPFEILTLLAIVVGPIGAVLVTRWVDHRREAYQRRMDIFRTLMRTRRTPMLPEHVGALNLIEIEYAKDDDVIAAWRLLFQHFGMQHLRRPDEQVVECKSEEEKASRDRDFYNRLQDERQRLLAKVLHAMAKRLRFRTEQLDIFEGGYTPQGWVDVEMEQQAVRRFFIDLALARRVVPIGVIDFRRAETPPASADPTSEPKIPSKS